jgi:hypothetical protein
MLKRQTTTFMSCKVHDPLAMWTFDESVETLFWYGFLTDLCSVEGTWNHSGNLRFQPCSKIFKTFPRVVSCCCISYVPQRLCGICAVPSQIDNCCSLKSKTHLAQYCHLGLLAGVAVNWSWRLNNSWIYCCSIACSLERCQKLRNTLCLHLELHMHLMKKWTMKMNLLQLANFKQKKLNLVVPIKFAWPCKILWRNFQTFALCNFAMNANLIRPYKRFCSILFFIAPCKISSLMKRVQNSLYLILDTLTTSFAFSLIWSSFEC